MARALLGHVGPVQSQLLASEVARLRRRVAELESEVARLRETRTASLDSHIDLELHRITSTIDGDIDAAPALA